MPERTMLLMTDGQRKKVIDKMGHRFRNWPKLDRALAQFAPQLDRELAQWIIESYHMPEPDTQAIVESVVRHYEKLRAVVTRAKTGNLKVFAESRWHTMIEPGHPYDWHQCNSFSFGGWRSADTFSASEVCRAASVNPELVNAIYQSYRPGPMPEQGMSAVEFQSERLQLITDLLPFREIEWVCFAGDECVGGEMYTRNSATVDITAVRALCTK